MSSYNIINLVKKKSLILQIKPFSLLGVPKNPNGIQCAFVVIYGNILIIAHDSGQGVYQNGKKYHK